MRRRGAVLALATATSVAASMAIVACAPATRTSGASSPSPTPEAAVSHSPPASGGTEAPPRAADRRDPTDSIRALPGYRPPLDTTKYLAPTRIERLMSGAARASWLAYVERSRRQRASDSMAMAAELRTAGLTAVTPGPYLREFEITKQMTPAWFATDSAQRVARNILTFQAPNGGWSKHIDVFTRPRQPGENYFGESAKWDWIATIDNSATTTELEFLAGANAAHPDPAYRDAFVRGVDYLLAAQMPNGCWPQVWPLAGSYHDAITYNDDAIANVAALLEDVAAGKYEFVEGTLRARASDATTRVLPCILSTQVVVNGRLTIWGQQHDPLTSAPVSARSYEHASLATKESAAIVRYLMRLREPDARTVSAVHAAVDWFRAHELYGYVYTPYERRDSVGAGPLWARLIEIESDRPLFSNRDGIRLYDYNQLTDRRTGYGWYTDTPSGVLKAYTRWAARHPRGGEPGADLGDAGAHPGDADADRGGAGAGVDDGGAR